MAEYVAKKNELEAFQYDGDLENRNGYYVPDWAKRAHQAGILFFASSSPLEPPTDLFISGYDGGSPAIVPLGHYLIYGPDDVILTMRPQEFESLYELKDRAARPC